MGPEGVFAGCDGGESGKKASALGRWMGGSQKTERAQLNPRKQKSSQEAPGHRLDSSLRSAEENWEGRMTFAS